jgi:hypothetical protein
MLIRTRSKKSAPIYAERWLGKSTPQKKTVPNRRAAGSTLREFGREAVPPQFEIRGSPITIIGIVVVGIPPSRMSGVGIAEAEDLT